jgi:hypothetical protein
MVRLNTGDFADAAKTQTPKNKPIKIIGHMIFKLNENDKGYYEYQWK